MELNNDQWTYYCNNNNTNCTVYPILCNRYFKQDCPLPLLFYGCVCRWYCKKKKNHKYSYIKHKTDTHSSDFNYTIYRINWDHHEHLCSQVKSSQVCEILFSVSVALLVCIDSIALFNYSISLRIIFGSFTREMDILTYVCTCTSTSKWQYAYIWNNKRIRHTI